MNNSCDVLIIGAGLSGLQAAYYLQQAGLSVRVLEARDRVGGKLWSVPSSAGQGTIELGGAWINNVNQPLVSALVRKFNLEMIEQNIVGDCILEGCGRFAYGSDPPLPESDRAAFVQVRDSMEALCHTVDLSRPGGAHSKYENLSVDSLAVSLGATDLTRKIVNLWTSAMLGVSSSDIGALYFLDYCRVSGGLKQMRSDGKGGGQHLRFRSGSQSLATGLMDCLAPYSVTFSAVVEEIKQHSTQGCLVYTKDGRVFNSRKVVSSVPSILLQDITIYPPLSADKTWLSTGSKLGFYAKVFLRYDTPWWRQKGMCGLAQGLTGPVSLTRDTSSDKDDMFTLACFVVGESGRLWSEKPEDQRMVDILKHIDEIYGERCPQPTATEQQIWNHEPFSKGAPCPVVPASCMHSLRRDQWRPEGHLHFCGTETGAVWKGYMEGALQSGRRVAKEVIGELGPRPKPLAKL